MTNIEKLKQLMRDCADASEPRDEREYCDRMQNQTTLDAMALAMLPALPALIAVAEAAKRLDDAPTAKQQDAAEMEIRDVLAALGAVEL